MKKTQLLSKLRSSNYNSIAANSAISTSTHKTLKLYMQYLLGNLKSTYTHHSLIISLLDVRNSFMRGRSR